MAIIGYGETSDPPKHTANIAIHQCLCQTIIMTTQKINLCEEDNYI